MAVTSRTLRFGDLQIGITTPDPGDLVWLAEFLRPGFVPGRTGAVDSVVRLTVDADRHRRLLAKCSGRPSRAVACFALDTRMVSLPSWRLDGRDRTIFDEEFGVLYVVREAGADVEILGQTPDRWHGRIPLLRVVRELAMNHAIARGGVLVHGAAIRLEGRGIVLAGPKRAGKTTMLTWLLGEPHARYVANDRVLVRFDGAGPVFHGVATIVTLRAEMTRRFPRLRRRVRASSYNPCLTLREARARPLGRIATDDQGRYHLSPAQYLELMGARPAPGGRLHALVFPRLTQRPGRLEMQPLTPDVALVRLRGALFRAAAPRLASEVFAPSSVPPRPPTVGALRRLVSSVPCFECRVGSRAFDGRRGITRLCDRGF